MNHPIRVWILDHFLVHFLDHFWGPFWGAFWDQIGPRRGEDGPKSATKSFKDPKSCICKKLKKPSVFEGFWGPEASQERLRKPQKAPKRDLKSSKTSKNMKKNVTGF